MLFCMHISHTRTQHCPATAILNSKIRKIQKEIIRVHSTIFVEKKLAYLYATLIQNDTLFLKSSNEQDGL